MLSLSFFIFYKRRITNDYENPAFLRVGPMVGPLFLYGAEILLFHGIEFKTDSKRVFLFIPVCTEQYELP